MPTVYGKVVSSLTFFRLSNSLLECYSKQRRQVTADCGAVAAKEFHDNLIEFYLLPFKETIGKFCSVSTETRTLFDIPMTSNATNLTISKLLVLITVIVVYIALWLDTHTGKVDVVM